MRFGNVLYKNDKLSMLIYLIAAVTALLGVIASIIIILDNKKKRENEELEQYLDGVIQ
ncbi:MAG: hypothetical protein Q4B14_04530 [Clostridia bacterium]|nr:hypothetical protein [Clostridia bacterium]